LIRDLWLAVLCVLYARQIRLMRPNDLLHMRITVDWLLNHLGDQPGTAAGRALRAEVLRRRGQLDWLDSAGASMIGVARKD